MCGDRRKNPNAPQLHTRVADAEVCSTLNTEHCVCVSLYIYKYKYVHIWGRLSQQLSVRDEDDRCMIGLNRVINLHSK